jgi:hypothetical protein
MNLGPKANWENCFGQEIMGPELAIYCGQKFLRGVMAIVRKDKNYSGPWGVRLYGLQAGVGFHGSTVLNIFGILGFLLE